MRNRLLGLVISTGMLAAGAAFAAESSAPTMPGSTAPAAGAPSVPAPAASSASTTTSTTTHKDMTMAHAGVVKSFDAKTHMLTLQDGSSFVLGESLKGDDLKANEKITLNYKSDGQAKTVTDYKIVPKS
jgi:hypothetical protein